MKKLLGTLVLIVVTGPVWAIKDIEIKGSIGIDFKWDTSSMITTNSVSQVNFDEINSSVNTQYRFFSHPSKDSFYQTVVDKTMKGIEVVTFTEL